MARRVTNVHGERKVQVNSRKLGLGVLASVAALAGAVLGPQLVTGSTGSSHTALDLSAFARPASQRDRLPQVIRSMVLASHFSGAPARAVGKFRGYRFYLVPGQKDLTCITAARGQEAFGSCSSVKLLRASIIYTGKGTEDHGVLLAGVVANGYSSVSVPGSTSRVHRNVFFAKLPQANVTLTLHGRGVSDRRVTLPLGHRQR